MIQKIKISHRHNQNYAFNGFSSNSVVQTKANNISKTEKLQKNWHSFQDRFSTIYKTCIIISGDQDGSLGINTIYLSRISTISEPFSVLIGGPQPPSPLEVYIANEPSRLNP